MSEPAPLFDDRAITSNRARARQTGLVDFLRTWVLDEIQERLREVNRTFTQAIFIDPFEGPAVPEQAVIYPPQEAYEFAAGSADLITHFLSLHHANDPVGQLIQCRQALKPDGLLIAAMPGGETLVELRDALATAEIEATGGLSPRISPMGQIRDLGALLQRAGFALPVADLGRLTVTYPDMRALMHDLRGMGEANPMAARLRHFTQPKVISRAAEIYAQRYTDPDGRLIATFEIIFLTGWAPDESQPQALRPGSATTRLADALGALEIPVSDKDN